MAMGRRTDELRSNDGVWLQPCCFNVTTGGFSVLLKGLPGAQLGVHYHVGTVRGYALQGHWRYLEHDWREIAVYQRALLPHRTTAFDR